MHAIAGFLTFKPEHRDEVIATELLEFDEECLPIGSMVDPTLPARLEILLEPLW